MDPMKKATLQGYKANSIDEVPIGAVIVKDGKIISSAYNLREKDKIATHHAEILAIEKANKKLKSWRLDDCDIYVTLEPCPMCAGAIMNARLKSIHYAVEDADNGGFTKFNLSSCVNHNIEIIHNKEFEEENKNLIQNFFKQKRKAKK